MDIKRKDLWKIISIICVIATFVSEAIFLFFVLKLQMLPFSLILLIAVILAVINILPVILAFTRLKKHPKIHVFQIVSYLICIPIMVCSVIGSLALNKLDKTVDAVTKKPEISTVMGIYVLTENPANYLNDTKDFIFAVNDSYDKKNNDSMISDIEKKLNKRVKIKHFETMLKSIDALYNKEVDALIISESNVIVLEDLSGYETFLDKTKIIYEMNIYVDVQKENQSKRPSKHTFKDFFENIIEVINPNIKDESSDSMHDENISSNSDSQNNIPPTQNNNVPEKPLPEKPIGNADDSFIIFISGSDSRNGIMDKSLSDVNILAVINPKTNQILLINTPRDFFIPNPAFSGQKDKLTHCGLYGLKCSVSALSAFYNIPIDYFVQFNFNGFETLIDLLGGVTVYSPKNFKTTHGKYPIHIGNNHLDGKRALSFVRERHAFLGGDDTRGWNQMQVIRNLITQTSTSTLLSNYSEILDTVEGMFITNIDRRKIAQLAEAQLKDMSKWEIFSFAATGSLGKDKPATLGGDEATVVYPHAYSVNKAKKLIKRVVSNEVIRKTDLY